MPKENHPVLSAIPPKKRIIFLAVAIVVVLVLGLLVSRAAVPERSVAAYCKTYKQEKARLAALPGDTWPSGVFDVSVSDAGEIATSFGKLDKVAPKEVEPDIKMLQRLYAKVDADPSQAIAASLSGGAVDEAMMTWTSQHCRPFSEKQS